MAVTSSAATYGYGGGDGFSIPDGDEFGDSSSIVVGSGGTITSFNSLTIFGFTHTFVGDLVVTLSNGVTTVDILDRVGRAGPDFGSGWDLSGDFVFTLSGTALPLDADVSGGSGPFSTYANGTAGESSVFNGSLADFVGSSVVGTWTLTISDREGYDTGAIDGWEFNVTTGGGNNVPDSGATMGLLGAALALLAGLVRLHSRSQ